ncbi:transposase, partial [Paracoccus sp. AS002]
MSNLFWLGEAQMERLRPFFSQSHGKPRVDDRRVLSGMIFVNRNGLRWCDAPKEYPPGQDPLQPLEALEVSGKCHRSGCSHEHGVFARIMVGLAAESAEHKTMMIDATYLKAHRTASSLCVKRGA